MSFPNKDRFAWTNRSRAIVGSVFIIIALALWQPHIATQTLGFVCWGMIQVAPIVIPGIILAAWIMASGAGDKTALIFRKRAGTAILLASAVGAVMPVCGITILPLMAGMLAARVPLAPVMAFWLASPVTDPAMLGTTAATLGWHFAIGKTVAAMALGIFGGFATAMFARMTWALSPLRDNELVGSLSAACATGDGQFLPVIWRHPDRVRRFNVQFWTMVRLITFVLIPAFAAEYLLNSWLQPDTLSAYLGSESIWAVPLAVLVGGPAYIDGFAALPLTRALLDSGMSQGAALAFLVSGGVVSIWGALAIVPVLKTRPFLLYLGLALSGSMAVGWIFDLIV